MASTHDDAAPGDREIVFWRLDQERHYRTWDSGVGSTTYGGRWNSIGRHVVYGALDPSTAITEVAVHKGFKALDLVPHVLTRAKIPRTRPVHVITPAEIGNPNWLRPCAPSAGQQQFGGELLQTHAFLVIPSVVSPYSWNIVIDCASARGFYEKTFQGRFALDPRLDPPPRGTVT